MAKRKWTPLLELMEKGQVFAPDIWDCTSARMVESLGFKATMFSGAAFADSLGLPDIGLLTADDLVRQVQYICDYSSLPCIIDADDGYGDSPAVVYRLAQRLVQAGAAAIQIEDSTGMRGYPRYSYQLSAYTEYGAYEGAPQVMDCDIWLAKIAACLKACEGTDCIVIARTIAHFSEGLGPAMERLVRAHKLGAHITFIDGLHTLEEAKIVAATVPGHKIFPDISSTDGEGFAKLEDLDALGYKLVTCHFLELARALGMLGFGLKVKEDGNPKFVDDYQIEGVDIETDWKQWIKAEAEYDPNQWLKKEREFLTF